MEKISIEFEFIEILEFILIINSEKQMEWLKRFSPRVLIDKEILEIKSKNNVKIEIMKIVVAVTEFISLIVVILQLVKELV